MALLVVDSVAAVQAAVLAAAVQAAAVQAAAVEIEMVVRDQPQPPLLQTKRSLKHRVKAE